MKTHRTFTDRLAESVGSRYGALLLALIVMLVLYGFVDRHATIRWVLDIVYLGLIGSLLHAVSGRRWLKAFVIVTGLGAIVLGTLSRETDVVAFFPFGSVARAALYAVVIVVIFGDVLRRRDVDMDAVLGACCVYLLMGLAWEPAYSLVEWQIPNSFAMPQDLSLAGPETGPGSTLSDLVYFSLITMTTVGYGDITPRTPPARILAALQGVIAQLYIAIIIARLVGMELARRNGASTPSR